MSDLVTSHNITQHNRDWGVTITCPRGVYTGVSLLSFFITVTSFQCTLLSFAVVYSICLFSCRLETAEMAPWQNQSLFLLRFVCFNSQIGELATGSDYIDSLLKLTCCVRACCLTTSASVATNETILPEETCQSCLIQHPDPQSLTTEYLQTLHFM